MTNFDNKRPPKNVMDRAKSTLHSYPSADFRGSTGMSIVETRKLMRHIKLWNEAIREQVEIISEYNNPNWADLVVFVKKVCFLGYTDITRPHEHKDFLRETYAKLALIIELIPRIYADEEYQAYVLNTLKSFRGCLEIQERIEKADIKPTVLYGCSDNIDMLYTLTVKYSLGLTKKGALSNDKE